ncbi:hypothetical protein B0A49_13496 [Cryomyces minteri]|uniref:WSC domain-containing protein n=1 Tax=Cryomyces minteri TaxID=331657 RepID=A0A4V5NDB1_9PEZI|nr:hypothetical protein B0A49_13496 [Cryomyces minteri]
MPSYSSIALGLAAALATPASAFWRMSCPGRIATERADPVVSPGVVSGHVHTISGGNGFGFTMDYAQARASQCSSCPIKEDLSNYWTPKLYYHAQNGSFIDVPQAGDGAGVYGGMTVYYQQRPGPDNDKLHAYPENFRMVAGNPFKRNFTGDFAAQAVSFACLDYNGPAKAETHGFPNYNCPNGLRAQIYFPSCWNGKDLGDTGDHASHMSYPKDTHYDNGRCPDTHPKHMISIFYEVIYQTNLFANEWYGSSQPFVFAMGDSTGYGFHGDFVNGWDIKTLQAATDDCTANSGSTTDCSHFSFFTDKQCQSCIVPPSIDEKVTGVLDALPGCNPVTNGPEMAVPVAAANCAVKSTIGQAATYYTDMTTSKGWAYLGCGTDKISSRTFSAKSENNRNMTVANCIDYCSAAGYSYAGMEYSSECYCSNTLATDRAPVAGILGNCFMKCSGDSTEYCGGGSALSMYRKCSGGSCTNAQYGVVGNSTTSSSKRHLDSHRHHHAAHSS